MLHQWMRIIGKKGAVFTDLSIQNSDKNQTIDWDFDAIYIGKQFPFGNFHAWVDSPNATIETMKLSIFDGIDFKPVADVLDSSLSFSKNGVIQFVPEYGQSWSQRKTEDIPELANGPKIYDLYWLKLEFENPIDISTKIKQIGYLFTSEELLSTLDNDIDLYLAPLNQTDWIPQMLMASIQTAIDLKSRGLIIDEGQIVQFDDFFVSVAYKTLSIIYFNLGPDFEDKRQAAIKEYLNNLKTRRLTIDSNSDGKIDRVEMRNTIRTLTR